MDTKLCSFVKQVLMKEKFPKQFSFKKISYAFQCYLLIYEGGGDAVRSGWRLRQKFLSSFQYKTGGNINDCGRSIKWVNPVSTIQLAVCVPRLQENVSPWVGKVSSDFGKCSAQEEDEG